MRVLAARLLDVDVLACGHRHDRHRRVPVIRDRYRHGIDRLVVKGPPEVLDGLGPRSRQLRGPVHSLCQRPILYVAHIGDLRVADACQLIDVVQAPVIGPDDGKPHRVVRALRAAGSQPRGQGGETEACRNAHPNEFAAIR